MKTRMISERNTVTTCSALIVEVYLCVDEVGGGERYLCIPILEISDLCITVNDTN